MEDTTERGEETNQKGQGTDNGGPEWRVYLMNLNFGTEPQTKPLLGLDFVMRNTNWVPQRATPTPTRSTLRTEFLHWFGSVGPTVTQSQFLVGTIHLSKQCSSRFRRGSSTLPPPKTSYFLQGTTSPIFSPYLSLPLVSWFVTCVAGSLCFLEPHLCGFPFLRGSRHLPWSNLHFRSILRE